MNFHSDKWIIERVQEHYEEAKTLINDYFKKEEIQNILKNPDKPEYKVIQDITELKKYIEKNDNGNIESNENENENEDES